MFEEETVPLELNSDKDEDKAIFWTQLVFIFVSFFEAFIAGLVPTWSSSCRENPKVLGIANSFAAGVFLAIAFCHIIPEVVGDWDEHQAGKAKIFPLPEVLVFLGYTIILIVDKVLFDTHALWEDAAVGHAHDDHHDPADKRLEKNLKASMSKSQQLANQGDVKASRIEQKEGTEGAMKSYLNPHDRFAERMRASM